MGRKSLIIIAAVLSIICSFSPVIAGDADYENYLNKAKTFEANSNIKEANNYYLKAWELNPARYEAAYGLAKTYGWLGDKVAAAGYYEPLIGQYPQSLSLIESYEDFLKSSDQPDKALIDKIEKQIQDIKLKSDNDAKIGLAKTYYEKGNCLKAVNVLKEIKNSPEANFELAKSCHKLLNGSVALNLVENNNSEEAKALKEEIIKEQELVISPVFEMASRNGDTDQSYTAKEYGISVSKTILPDIKLNGTWTVSPFASKGDKVKGTINSYSLGSTGKIGLKTGYLGEITLDYFSDSELEILGKAELAHSFNDYISFRAGYLRAPVYDSFMSVYGVKPEAGAFAGQRVGRITDNKFMVSSSLKLPYRSYLYAGYNLGYKKGENSPSNTYSEIVAGLGKVLYATDESKLLNLVIAGYNLYYTGYEKDKLHYGGASLRFTPIGSDNEDISNTGGYFSPKSFISNTGSLMLKGYIKQLKLNFKNESILGLQHVYEQRSELTWGNTVSAIINEKGRIGLILSYQTFFYGTARQNIFSVHLILKEIFGKSKHIEKL